MIITKYWLYKWHPCEEAIDWLNEQDTRDVFELITRLKKLKEFDWIIWAIPRLLKTKRDRVRFAVYAAGLVLHKFEEKYPDDNRPRETLNLVKKWLKNPRSVTRDELERAGSAAWNAESAAWSERNAENARSAVWRSAESAAWSARNAAWSAAWSAENAESAAWSARNAEKKITTKIINYGIELLRKQEGR